jgi:hypothetical protein
LKVLGVQRAGAIEAHAARGWLMNGSRALARVVVEPFARVGADCRMPFSGSGESRDRTGDTLI